MAALMPGALRCLRFVETATTLHVAVPPGSAATVAGVVIARDVATNDAALWRLSDALATRAPDGAVEIVGEPHATRARATAGATAWCLDLGTDAGGLVLRIAGTGGRPVRWAASLTALDIA